MKGFDYYREILEQYNQYSDLPIDIKWTYPSYVNPNLVALRNKYAILRNCKNDLAGILKVLGWVHEMLLFSETAELEPPYHAIGVLSTCREIRKTVSCRICAIVLAECLMSIGLKVRVTKCAPQDVEDPDSHVVVLVFVDELDKWICLDAAYGLYVTDINECPLSIKEIRQCLISDQKINFAGCSRFYTLKNNDKEYLKEYYAKNFFRFSCWLHNCFCLDNADNLIVYLDPLGYTTKVENSRYILNKRLITVNNENVFWEEASP